MLEGSFSYNPLSPAATKVFSQIHTHITFIHELLKSIKKRNTQLFINWAQNAVGMVYCDKYWRELLFSLCINKKMIVEAN